MSRGNPMVEARIGTNLRVCDFFPAVILSVERRSRTESKDPTYDGSAGGFARFFTAPFATGCERKMCRRWWHRKQAWGASTPPRLAPRFRSARQEWRESKHHKLGAKAECNRRRVEGPHASLRSYRHKEPFRNSS